MNNSASKFKNIKVQKELVKSWFESLQQEICNVFEELRFILRAMVGVGFEEGMYGPLTQVYLIYSVTQ